MRGEVNVKVMVLWARTAGCQPGSLKDQGDFPGGSGNAAEAGRLCKMAWSRSSEHRLFPRNKGSKCDALELGKRGAHMND